LNAPQASQPRCSALLVGTAPRLALAVSRSLAARGVTVFAVPSTDDEGPLRTRAIARYFALPDGRDEPDAFDDGLERVVKSSGAGVLIPCSDTALASIARNDANLRALTTLACPSPKIIESVLDKSATIGFAQTLAIDIPETYEVGVTSTSHEAAALMAYPVIAKPRNHAAHGGIRIRHFTGPDELEAAFADDPAFESRYIVQQFVPGAGMGVAALMQGGEPIATFVHRRVKELPASGGVSVVSESAALDRSLVEKAIALLRAIGWEGVALVEFRRAADGTDWLMEVNGRYWGSLSTAIAAGVDFPFYQWEIIHGRKPDVPAEYPIGRRVRWTRGALLRLRERLFEPAGFGTRRLTKAQELRGFFAEDLARDVRSAMWTWREPLPAIIDALPGLSRLLASAMSAAFKPLVPRRFLRARRRFGTSGALRYSMFEIARTLGLRSELLPRPFAPRSVLFVCSGNVMRSVLAEAVFRAALAQRGVVVEVDSAGLRARSDLPAAGATLSEADEAGVDVTAHRSKHVDAVDLDAFDAVFAMDRLQAFEIGKSDPRAAGKTYLLGACLPGFSRVEIEDPSLAGDDERHEIFALVRERAAALAEAAAADLSARGATAAG
jgi:predicted ATP-grasp superfamily ATP-dependent carboligase/protein-tyrosine-phosphatase